MRREFAIAFLPSPAHFGFLGLRQLGGRRLVVGGATSTTSPRGELNPFPRNALSRDRGFSNPQTCHRIVSVGHYVPR